MAELRSSPRTHVAWRAAVRLEEAGIVPARVINIANNGVQLQCVSPLRDGASYQVMLEVPTAADAQHRVQILCRVACLYTILSGGEYRSGVKFIEIPAEHKQLLISWGIKIAHA